MSVKTDAPFYTEAELDALEATDPVAAVRISREQMQLQKLLAQSVGVAAGRMPGSEQVNELIADIRQILARDGGDIEFVSLEDGTLTVRLKGSCAGCPRAPLDLKHVVEAMVRRRYPQIAAVRNVL